MMSTCHKTQTNPPRHLPPPVPVDQGSGAASSSSYNILMLAVVGACVLNVDPVPLSPRAHAAANTRAARLHIGRCDGVRPSLGGRPFQNERAPMLHLIAVFFLTTWCAFALSSDGRCVCSLTERVQAPAVDQLQRWCIKKTDRSVCCLAILHAAPSPSPLPPISIHSPHLAAKALHS